MHLKIQYKKNSIYSIHYFSYIIWNIISEQQHSFSCTLAGIYEFSKTTTSRENSLVYVLPPVLLKMHLLKSMHTVPSTNQEFELQIHLPRYSPVTTTVSPVSYLQFPSIVSYQQHSVILVLGVPLPVQVCNHLKYES